MREGVEPVEPFRPEVYHYHAASAVIEIGDYQSAIREALERGKASVVPDEMRAVPATVGV